MRSTTTIRRAVLILSIALFSAFTLHVVDTFKQNQMMKAQLIELNKYNRDTAADRELYKSIARNLITDCVNSENITIRNIQYRCYQIYNL